MVLEALTPSQRRSLSQLLGKSVPTGGRRIPSEEPGAVNSRARRRRPGS